MRMHNQIRRLKRLGGIAIGLALALSSSHASAETVAITGGKVYPVSGPAIENGTVVIVDGKITAVGTNVPVPAGARTIDAHGKWVTPGFIHSSTALGVVEVDAVASSNDDSPKGAHGVAAAFRVWDALNPASELWAPARQGGVTAVVVAPSGDFVSGQAALVETLQGPATGMVRKAPVGMVVDLTNLESAEASARGEVLLRLRDLLDDAAAFGKGQSAYESNQLRALAARKSDLVALQPVLAGTLPLIVHVERAADIQALLALARERSLRVIVQGGAEAWKVANDLAAAKVPVLTGGLGNLPENFDQLGATLENASRLRKAGVAVAMTTDGGNNFFVRLIRQHAGNAIANGLPWDEALRAVTLTPAEIFGVADTMGSLQPGRQADVVVWDGDPFEFATRAEHVFVRGQESTERSREQMLTDRYKRSRQ
jgi:imidazolonepropionase-like amidohydrolase